MERSSVQSTFCESENFQHAGQVSTSITDNLKNLKKNLVKISTNVTQVTYLNMRCIRKEYFRICQSKNFFTKLDLNECTEIRKLLTKVKLTHPELFSKEEFLKTRNSNTKSFSETQETTFDRPSSDTMLSENVLDVNSEVFKVPEIPQQKRVTRSTVKKQTIEKETLQNSVQDSLTTKYMRNSQQPVAADISDTHDNLTLSENIKLYKKWAVELREFMKKEQKQQQQQEKHNNELIETR